MTLADYMAACLLDPEEGYYTTRLPFGAAGDFVTAPEISQMFGELLGLALAQAWFDQGAPAPFVLAELGPGRGTLMADALRALRRAPGFAEAAQVHLVEASPALREVQRKTLAGHEVQWCDSLDDLPEGPLFLIANEFFDALPIRQFQRTRTAWSERVVTVEGGRLGLALAPEAPVAALAPRLADTSPGDIVETCAPARAIAEEIGVRIASDGGAAILVDYGGWHSLGDTFQAVHAHQITDPFEAPGAADLTAHVDFEALATALAPAQVSGLTGQGALLTRLGIRQRSAALAAGLTGEALENHLAATERLTSEAEMGTLFKALGVTAPGAPPIPGFDP
jgi:SAM-dependent MidA family methyltransferase